MAIGPADEALLAALLASLLSDRQLAVPETVQDWLRLRLPRTAAAMREAAARLDHLALADGGRVTRVTAARVAAEMTEPPEILQFEPASSGVAELAEIGRLRDDPAEYEDFTQSASDGSTGSPRLL